MPMIYVTSNLTDALFHLEYQLYSDGTMYAEAHTPYQVNAINYGSVLVRWYDVAGYNKPAEETKPVPGDADVTFHGVFTPISPEPTPGIGGSKWLLAGVGALALLLLFKRKKR